MDKAFKEVTLREALEQASLFLSERNHHQGSAKYYWMMWKDQSLTDLVKELNQPVSQLDYLGFQEVVRRVVNDEPIQYIIGYADFLDRRFKVTPDTLIPREETAGLIEIMAPYLLKRPNAKVLDMGTGSGILAVSIKAQYPKVKMTASDICQGALSVAQENAKYHQTDIEFIHSDLFRAFHGRTFDLIVSNPPYISEDERSMMDASVLKFEPRGALFADKEGLGIYEAIASQVSHYLDDQGLIFLEIGYAQGDRVSKIFQEALPQSRIQVKQDFNGRDRYVIVERKEE